MKKNPPTQRALPKQPVWLSMRNPINMVAVAVVSMGLYACGGDEGDGGATPVEPARTLVSIAVSEAPTSVFAKTAKFLVRVASLPIGLTQQYVATGTYSDNTTADLTTTASWSSTDDSVATVVAGAALAKLTGETNIRACQEEVCGDPVKLAVSDSVVTKLTVTVPQAEVREAGVSELTATASFSDGHELEVTTDPGLTWTSSDETTLATQVARSPTGIPYVESALGRFFGVKEGVATVSVAGQFNGAPFSDEADIAVTPLEATDFPPPEAAVQDWSQADAYCKTLPSAARLPTRLELQHIYTKAMEEGGSVCDIYSWPMGENNCDGSDYSYWTGEVDEDGDHYIIGMDNSNLYTRPDTWTAQVVCVH